MSYTTRDFKELFDVANDTNTGILWDRDSGDDGKTHERLTTEDPRHCNDLNNYIKQFLCF